MGAWEFIWKSILLGTVQGLTEFLPVSSSGHLSLFQRLLGYDLGGASMTFVNVMLHLGTLMPVFWLFRKEIFALFKKPYKLLFMLTVATVPAGVVGLLFHRGIDSLFSSTLLPLAFCFFATAAMLLVCEHMARRQRGELALGWREAGAMGLMQAVALFPGISRSGSTLFAGSLFGARREEIARFSFLMSIPVILGSALVEGKDAFFGGAAALGGYEAAGMLLGMIAAAVSGFFAIKLMLKVIQKANYKWFSLYLALLALFCMHLNALGLFLHT